MTRAALALTLLLALGGPAGAARLLIQVWFDKGLPYNLPDGDDPGRLEVEIKGVFVGCALANWYRTGEGEIRMLPLSVGFTAEGEKSDVKVRVDGQLEQFAYNLKVTEIVPVAD